MRWCQIRSACATVTRSVRKRFRKPDREPRTANREPRTASREARSQISLAQQSHVMRDVAGGDVGERAHGERVAARHATAHPCVGWQIAEERERGRPYGAELLDVAAQRAFIGRRAANRDVLVETRQRGLEPPREPQRAEHEQAFRVVQMADDFANAPLAGLIPVQRSILGYAAKELNSLKSLRLDDLRDVPVRHLVDVGEVVLGGFATIRSIHAHYSWNSDAKRTNACASAKLLTRPREIRTAPLLFGATQCRNPS